MNNGRLAVLVPSRGRPKVFERFYESFIDNQSGCSDVILRNGEADPAKDQYATFEGRPYLTRVVGPDSGFLSTWKGTAGYNPAQQDLYYRFPDYAAYLCIEDDCVLHTPEFDKTLLRMFNHFSNRVGCLSLLDRSQTIQVFALSAEWCSALGRLFDPAVGEQGFNQVLNLAMRQPTQIMLTDVEFTHKPHLSQYGYTGDERRGALDQPDVVAEFYNQQALLDTWMSERAFDDKAKLVRKALFT